MTALTSLAEHPLMYAVRKPIQRKHRPGLL